MFECINVCPSTACLKMVSKYIESYGKHALAVNERHPKKAIQEAILCFTYFRLIEKGLFHPLCIVSIYKPTYMITLETAYWYPTVIILVRLLCFDAVIMQAHGLGWWNLGSYRFCSSNAGHACDIKMYRIRQSLSYLHNLAIS